jgi:uncharacterized membrane protein YdjX (TVP38/TMEM64 family)
MKKLPFFISLSLLSVLLACYFFVPSFQAFIDTAFDVLTSNDEDKIQRWVAQFGIAGPIVLVLTMIVQMFLFVVPNVFIMIVAIVSYGPIWGAVISFVGVFASSSFGYFIGKCLGPVTVNKLLSIKAQIKTADFIQNYGIPAIAITRICSLSNDSLSIVAGLLKMNYRKYILATLIGISPLIILLAVYGNNGKILKALIWIAAISFVFLIAYIIIDKRRKRNRAVDRQPSTVDSSQ